ncbi:MAG: hypothetical protein ABIO44_10480, partial [Saprospiraceae bacterium]
MRIFILLDLIFFIFAFQSNFHKTSKTSILTYNSNAQTTNIIFQSDDDGQTWKDLSAGLPEKVTVDRVFVQGEDIYLAAGNGVIYHNNHTQTGIWESENVGGIFMNAAAIFPKEKIIGLFPGRYGLYACVYKNGFSRKILGTNNWQQMGYALEDKTIHCVLEKPDGTIFITCQSGIYKSDNDGKSWKQIFSDGWVSGLVLANGVFIANGAHGLIRSTDDGEQWEYVLKDDGGSYRTSVIDGGFAAVRLAGIWRTSADNF